jgi:hypothetical protein
MREERRRKKSGGEETRERTKEEEKRGRETGEGAAAVNVGTLCGYAVLWQ